MSPKLVLFDLDDTLFDHIGTVERALAEVARRFPVLASRTLPELVAENQRVLEEAHLRVCRGEVDMDEARIERIQRLFEFCGGECSADEAAAVAAIYRPAYQAGRRAVAGALELLAALRGRTTVGIVSNNMTAEQWSKLKAIGLDDLIDFMVTSEDVGILKPDAGIYLRALQIGQATAAEAVFVGDAWENDVVGPQAVGIPAIWVSHGRHAPADPTPYAIANDLYAVARLLGI